MKQKNLIIIAAALVVVLIGLLIIAGNLDQHNGPVSVESQPTDPVTGPSSEPTTEPSSEPTQEPTSEPTTEPTVEPTEEPTTAPTTAPSTPSVNGSEMIGSLYTRQELENMENVNKGYGPGTASNGNRAPYAVNNQAAYGQYGGNFIGPDNNCIYLTFDCGYEYNNLTTDILNTLKEKNVKAVFFVTMQFVKQHPELVQRMIDEGHAVGNHTVHHPVMTSLTIDKMVSEVMELHDYVLEKFGYKMTLFRPPTGAFSTRTLAVVQSLGYKNVHWSFAYADWDTANQPAPDKALKTITERHHSGAIYLLHAVSSTNAAVLGDAIDFFLAQGYQLELFQ